jgi:hypothetical protein
LYEPTFHSVWSVEGLPALGTNSTLQSLQSYRVQQANFLLWTERSEGKRKLACRTLYLLFTRAATMELLFSIGHYLPGLPAVWSFKILHWNTHFQSFNFLFFYFYVSGVCLTLIEGNWSITLFDVKRTTPSSMMNLISLHKTLFIFWSWKIHYQKGLDIGESALQL